MSDLHIELVVTEQSQIAAQCGICEQREVVGPALLENAEYRVEQFRLAHRQCVEPHGARRG